jgi:predicted Rossmann fold flavoprotein
MFPTTDNSQTIIECLLKEASKYGVEIMMQTEVTKITASTESYELQTPNTKLQTDYICIACGGYPKSSMFDWLRTLGHTVEEPVPSLFTFNMPKNPVTQLMGVSVEKAIVKIQGTKLVEQGPLLITHWGMSGPVILRLSAWGARQLGEMKYRFTAQVNWVPDYSEQSLREHWPQLREQYAGQNLSGRNPFGLPARLWQYLLQDAGIPATRRWSELATKEQNKLIRNLAAQEFAVDGKTTFKEEFVTCGGIKLAEVDPNTMESRVRPGIFFAGEVMDVDGITGGFNFQHAWTSGWIAAKTIGDRSL